LAIFQQSSNWSAPIGALLGIAASLCVGYAIYVRGMRLDLQRFFKVTSCFILFVAAGLLASSVRKFHEAGIWNHLQTVVFDLSDALPMDSPLGAILAGLLGYQAAPVSGEVIVYLAFLCLSVPFLLRPSWSSPIT